MDVWKGESNFPPEKSFSPEYKEEAVKMVIETDSGRGRAVSDDMAARAARATAKELAPQYGQRLEAGVEAALYSTGESKPPSQYFDPVAVGSLIVSIATLAWQIYSDRKKQGEKPTKDTMARVLRLERSKSIDLTAAEENIIEMVSAEIIKLSDTDE